MYRLATKHSTKKRTDDNSASEIRQVSAAGACDVNKVSITSGSALPYRRGAATASSRRFGCVALMYVVCSTTVDFTKL